MNPMRFAMQAAGAGVGIWAGQVYIAPMLPEALGYGDYDSSTLGVDDVVVGAFAVLGAMAGNALYSKFFA